MRHGTLNFRALLSSIVLHGIVCGAVAWTIYLPREVVQPPKKEPVIATLWSGPASKPEPKSEPAPQTPSVLPSAPASEPAVEEITLNNSQADSPVKPISAPAVPTETAWGETSPLAPAPGTVPPPSDVAAAQVEAPGAVDFDEAMRRAAEKVAASGATQLKSTDLNSLESTDGSVNEPHQSIEQPSAEVPHEDVQDALSKAGEIDDEVLSSSFDPLSLYQQKIALLIQKSLRLSRAPSGSRCVMGIQIMNNGLIVESYQLGGDPGLCDDAIQATARVGALPPPPKELGEGRFHNLRVSILF